MFDTLQGRRRSEPRLVLNTAPGVRMEGLLWLLWLPWLLWLLWPTSPSAMENIQINLSNIAKVKTEVALGYFLQTIAASARLVSAVS